VQLGPGGVAAGIRANALNTTLLNQLTRLLNRAETFSHHRLKNVVVGQLNAAADLLVDDRYSALRQALRDLAATF
jgi:hypothetical protein